MVTNVKYFDIQRKIVANITGESWREAPLASVSYETDAQAVLDKLKEINKTKDDKHKVTFNTLMLKVFAESLKKAPAMNAHIHFDYFTVAGSITEYDNIDISVPMLLPNGQMMTVRVPDVGNKSLDEITEYMADIVRRMEKTNLAQTMYEVSIDNTLQSLKRFHPIKTAGRLLGAFTGDSKIKVLRGKAKKAYDSIPATERLTKDDLRQGTFTVSNIGSIYRTGKVKSNLLDTVKPQICAICLDSLFNKDELVTDAKGKVSVVRKKYMSFCTAFDHRALDFDALVPFFESIDVIFSEPSVIDEWNV